MPALPPDTAPAEAEAGEPVAEALATFVQKPRIGRWLISLLGLLAAAAVFAAVLSRTLDQFSEDAEANQDLVLEALDDDAASGGTKIPANPGLVNGSVISASTGDGIAGMEAELFTSANGTEPVATAATASDGTFALGNLSRGIYKLRLSGAGFQELWYDGSASFVDATEIEVELDSPMTLPPSLGGRPGSVSGTVVADDPTGTTATLVRPGVIDPETDAQVQEVQVSADGSFVFEAVPSPASYQLVVSRPGSTTVVRDVVLGPGQAVDDIEVVLLGGDGVISGTVATPDGPLGAATVEGTDGV